MDIYGAVNDDNPVNEYQSLLVKYPTSINTPYPLRRMRGLGLRPIHFVDSQTVSPLDI